MQQDNRQIPDDGLPPYRRLQLLALIAITLLAAALRLYKIGEWSFWVDEGHTFRDVASPIDEFWKSHVARYPLSYLMLRGLLDFLPSTSEGWLRLPFAFFGIASVPALALVGRSMVGRTPALIAALFLAVSPWHIYWSQNCRSYSMVLFWTLLASGAFYHGLLHRMPWLLVATVVLTLIAGACHMSVYLLLIVFIGFAFLRRYMTTGSDIADQARSWIERLWPWLLLAVIAALVPVIVGGISYFRQAKPDVSLLHLAQTTVYFVRIPLGVAAVGGFLWLLQSREQSALFLMCWLLLPLLVLAVVASTIFKVTAQYAFYTLPAFCLLAGGAVHGYVAHISSRGALATVMRAIPLGIILFDMLGYNVLYFTRQHGDRPDWRAAKSYIERDQGGRKLVLTTNAPSMLYYLDPGAFRTGRSSTVQGLFPWDLEKGPERFLRQKVQWARDHDTRLYVVVTEPELQEMDPERRFDHALRHTLRQVQRYPVWTGPKDMTVLVYELPDADEGARPR